MNLEIGASQIGDQVLVHLALGKIKGGNENYELQMKGFGVGIGCICMWPFRGYEAKMGFVYRQGMMKMHCLLQDFGYVNTCIQFSST